MLLVTLLQPKPKEVEEEPLHNGCSSSLSSSQKQTTNTGTVDSVVTNQNAKNKIEVVAVDVIENTADKIISVDEQMEPFHAVSNGNNGLSNCEITI